MSKNYYEKNGIIVRPTKRSDIEYLKTRLKKEDVDEIWAAHHLTPAEALEEGWKHSMICLTVQNGVPQAIFGINPVSFTSQKAVIWFLSSEDIFKIKTRFLKNSRKFVDMFLNWYPILFNFVSADSKKTLAWLRFLNAEIDEAEPHGPDNQLFHKFTFLR